MQRQAAQLRGAVDGAGVGVDAAFIVDVVWMLLIFGLGVGDGMDVGHARAIDAGDSGHEFHLGGRWDLRLME